MNKLKEIQKQAGQLTVSDLTQAIISRAEFLERFPVQTEFVIEGEKLHGAFLGCASIPFADGRLLCMYKFERGYQMDFYNPNLPEVEKQNRVIALSYEMVHAFALLHSVFLGNEDTRRFWKAIGIPAEEVEEFLAEKTETELQDEQKTESAE